ncbi:HIT family protein [Allobaculum mucilyticum]|uniref:HIT family protein n=1 Tax=Allobaculum mucilyticum TaxID=2834459 RepID=UPI001E3BD3C7|nr:HIT family protein [Allobaculum mucilyticum]UNT95219.1 HIT family protein [Allobaculum mucilyticum]
MSCLFCSIANGEIPSATIYEDEYLRVIFDINPASYGHALIIPKTHSASLLEADDETLEHVFKTARKLGNKMISELGAEGVNVIANCKEAAGQTIDHFHVHVIPRYTGQPEKDVLHISQDELEKPDFEALAVKLALN